VRHYETRLDRLCNIHKQQGGTIHQFNRQYGTDFLALTDEEFDAKTLEILKDRVMDFMTANTNQENQCKS
jgi:hypothetical protein